MGRKKKNHADCGGVDERRLVEGLGSPDEAVRSRAVRSLCPCHAGWELFERHVGSVARLERDRSRRVRAEALHVFDDAVKMQNDANMVYRVQAAEELTRGKRASRFRPGEAEALAARRGKRRGRSGVYLGQPARRMR